MNVPRVVSVWLTIITLSHPITALRRHASLFDSTYLQSGQSEYTHRLLRDDEYKQKVESIIDSVNGSSTTKYSNKQRNLSLPKPSDHLVTDLPFLQPGTLTTKHYAGHIPASMNDDKKLFYWLFEPDISNAPSHSDQDIPLLIWLNGGPGCSSMDGLFLENGPIRLVNNDRVSSDGWTIETNPFSWHKAPAYVLYVDQPVGTGLSFTKKKKYCKNDLEINIDFHLFLENFLIMYEDFFLVQGSDDSEQRTMVRPLYFSGESHAGHYIPSMMQYILERNDDTSKTTRPRVKMNLRGGAIGNGWVDPYHQYAAADLAYSIGIIDTAQKQSLDKKELVCRQHLKDKNYKSSVCFDLLDDIIGDSSGKSGSARVSIYDYRYWEKNGSSRSFPPGHKDVEQYLGGLHSGMNVDYQAVLRALHAEESISVGQRYRECTDPPYNALAHQDGLGVTKEVVQILEHNTKPKLFFFNGMNDMICNHIGNDKVLDNLDWKHTNDWILAKRYAWEYNSLFTGEGQTHGPVGYYKEYDNLAFLKIASSGHMMPMDLPDVALEMIRKFMFHVSFGSNNQNLKSSVPQDNAACLSCPTCPISTLEHQPVEQKSVINQQPSQDQQSVEHKPKNNVSDGNDNDEEAEESRILSLSRQFMLGGGFGIAIGVSFMLFINLRKKKMSKRSELLAIAHNDSNDCDEFGYSDDPETELVSSPLNLPRSINGEMS